MLSTIEKRAISVLKRCIKLNNLHTHSPQQSPLLIETFARWNCPLSNNDRPKSKIINRTMVVVTQTKASEESTTSFSATAATAMSEQNSNVTTSTATTTVSQEQQQDQQSNLSAIVTDACYQRIRYLISQKMKQQQTENNNNNNSSNDDHLYLRVFVDAGGCSGFTYQFELDKDSNLNPEEDVVFTDPISNNDVVARVVVDRGSLNLINGSTIDYVQEMIKSTFEVRDNPQSESACGCGSSFALKNFASNPAID